MQRRYGSGKTTADDNQIKEVPSICSERLESETVKPDNEIECVKKCEEQEDAIGLGVRHNVVRVILCPAQSANFIAKDSHQKDDMKVVNDSEPSCPIAMFVGRSIVAP